MPDADFEGCLQRFQVAHPWLPAALARRYLRSYGTRAGNLLKGATDLAGLGENFGAGLYAAELDYLVEAEWAETAEDVLWRRSKLGLHMSEGLKRNLDDAFIRRFAATGRQETQKETG
jgi:glycerol-3-phosphate dehydrogenase